MPFYRFAFSKSVFCASTKVFEETLNAVKFLGWLKIFRLPQNTLGLVKGQGINVIWQIFFARGVNSLENHNKIYQSLNDNNKRFLLCSIWQFDEILSMIKGSIPTSDSRLLDAAETLVTLQSRGGGRGRQTGRIFKISHLKVGTTLGDTGCFRFQGIKVLWILQFLGYFRTLSLKFQRATIILLKLSWVCPVGCLSSILVRAFWNFQLKILKYPRNYGLHNTLIPNLVKPLPHILRKTRNCFKKNTLWIWRTWIPTLKLLFSTKGHPR